MNPRDLAVQSLVFSLLGENCTRVRLEIGRDLMGPLT
jgi:hypothetical protein